MFELNLLLVFKLVFYCYNYKFKHFLYIFLHLRSEKNVKRIKRFSLTILQTFSNVKKHYMKSCYTSILCPSSL